MENRLIYKKDQLKSAVEDFRKSLDLNLSGLEDDVIDTVKSGRAQKFEFCVELLWKTVKVFLHEIHGIDENSPKSVIKALYTLQYLTPPEFESILGMIDDRNSLSNIYKKEQFLVIYTRIAGSLPMFEKIQQIINS